MDHIEFLAHVFSESGMQLSDEKAKVKGKLLNYRAQFFVGTVNYFRDYEWTIGSSDTLNDVNKEEIQLGRIFIKAIAGVLVQIMLKGESRNHISSSHRPIRTSLKMRNIELKLYFTPLSTAVPIHIKAG